MADITAGLGNLNNQVINSFNNRTNLSSFNQDIMDYRNISKLDDFLISPDNENSELLKGVVTKIQGGQRLEEADFEGLSGEQSQFAKDLQQVINIPGQGGGPHESLYGPQDVANKFSNLLDSYLNNVNSQHKQAEKAVETFAAGGDIDIHSVMIASEKASLSMQLAVQMKSKITEAYRQIQNIRV